MPSVLVDHCYSSVVNLGRVKEQTNENMHTVGQAIAIDQGLGSNVKNYHNYKKRHGSSDEDDYV